MDSVSYYEISGCTKKEPLNGALFDNYVSVI